MLAALVAQTRAPHCPPSIDVLAQPTALVGEGLENFLAT